MMPTMPVMAPGIWPVMMQDPVSHHQQQEHMAAMKSSWERFAARTARQQEHMAEKQTENVLSSLVGNEALEIVESAQETEEQAPEFAMPKKCRWRIPKRSP